MFLTFNHPQWTLLDVSTKLVNQGVNHRSPPGSQQWLACGSCCWGDPSAFHSLDTHCDTIERWRSPGGCWKPQGMEVMQTAKKYWRIFWIFFLCCDFEIWYDHCFKEETIYNDIQWPFSLPRCVPKDAARVPSLIWSCSCVTTPLSDAWLANLGGGTISRCAKGCRKWINGRKQNDEIWWNMMEYCHRQCEPAFLPWFWYVSFLEVISWESQVLQLSKTL